MEQTSIKVNNPSLFGRLVLLKHEAGADRLQVESVIQKMFFPLHDDLIGIKIETFWREYNDFETKRGPSYSRAWIWQSEEIKKGNDHVWHKLYSIPFTEVFGLVACRVCSKPLGCGLAERNWGTLKHLKTGKRSHLSGDKSQKQATVYGAACIERARAHEKAEESSGLVVESRWTDEDIAFQMGLESWDHLPGMLPTFVRPKRLFRAWMEPWEFECIYDDDPVSEARLLQKYGGMSWIDPDEDELCRADDTEMEWQGGKGGAGWCLIGTKLSDGSTEPWIIDVIIDQIGAYEQPNEMNVEVLVNTDLRAANAIQIQELKGNKKQKSAPKRNTKRKK